MFDAPWGGSALDHLGHERLQEGNAMGPMSLSVDAQGRVYVLDEINGRIVRRDANGKPEKAMSIGLQTPEDMVIAKDGTMVVLDRHTNAQVALYDADGKEKGTLPLDGDGLADPGLVTGVFTDGDDVYVEREHGPLVKLGTTAGAPSDHTEIPGRPTRDGLSYISAGITDAGAGRVYVASSDRASGDHRFTRELRMRSLVHSIALLDTDKSGVIYFAVEIADEKGAASVVLSCLEPLHGAVIGTVNLPANTLPEETFRDYVVLDGGGVLYALRTEAGVSYYEADCS